MVDLFLQVRKMKTLQNAWRVVKSSAQFSSSEEIRNSSNEFEADSISNLRRIQARLKSGSFVFKPQKGIAKRREGKDPRPLVISPIENRIVQRAVLDVLQAHVSYVDSVLSVPTSFGGIRGKSVEAAIIRLKQEFSLGAKFYVRSDIPSFFTKVNRSLVLNEMRKHVPSDDFFRLFQSSIETTLSNLTDLSRQRLAEFFPIGMDGVAQGSPLSPLVANLYLAEFDREMNSAGITCIHYIDDFVILGSTEKDVSSAFRRASAILKRVGLNAYSPYEASDKASHGRVSDGFDFLGCQVTPGLVQPCKKARGNLLSKIDDEIRQAKYAAKHIIDGGELFAVGCYAQAVTKINRIVWGWGKSFSFCNGEQLARSLDEKISEKLNQLELEIKRVLVGADYRMRQKVMGVSLLEDMFRQEDKA
ncbi:reverse transcriptase domain-containing protein [Pseudomonas sp. 148P]|uniref:Reverse transcriptase domain-containing protein n=1 Tax=Pseudomonas ulcerans TaxID=3115852 RepID=A0ABU7HQV8_9PSED|nr:MULTISPECIES: reverse transcriptase domain-containing protein [unclassified Pseudomonas]MEE1925448.1 reverse transcriptase domain-containing protein [Pseudomonas sp. 147P]MEE1933902.1 reverse transcriptase domain-containing protein [Pseudomonas sp. 148P]